MFFDHDERNEPSELINGYIKLQIPEEIKNDFRRSKYLFETLEDQDKEIEILANLIYDQDTVGILEKVIELTTKSPKGWVMKEEFFKSYPEWFEKTLIEILKIKSIDAENKKEEMYKCLFITQYVIRKNEQFDILWQRDIENESRELYLKTINTMNLNISKEVSIMIDTFIELALGNIEYKNQKLFLKRNHKTKKYFQHGNLFPRRTFFNL